MTELPVYNKILVILIDLVAVWLAFIVYSDNPKKKLNKTFLLMTIFMLFWVNFAFLARLVSKNNLSLAETFLRIAWFVTPLLFTALYFLIINLLKKEKEYRLITAGIVFVGVGSAVVAGFTNWIVAGTRFVNEILRIVYGIGMIPFLGGISLIICATLYSLFNGYLKGSTEERKKLEYFIVGSLIFYLANIIFNIVLPMLYDIVRFYFIGDYSTIFLLGFTAYAIVTQELFGIRVVLTQSLVMAIAILLLWQATVSLPNWVEFSWKFGLFLSFVYFGYFLVKSVIQEIKRRAEIQRLYEEVDRLSRAKSEFISIVSHQLRTPLTAIKGYISMMLEGDYGKIEKRPKSKLKNVYQSNEKLISFINDLLDMSRVEAGKIELELGKGRIEDIISSEVDDLQTKASEKGLYLNWEKPKKPLPEITMDLGKTEQVVANLIDNAIKYTQKGGVTIKCQISNFKCQIVVSDTGRGMEKDELNKLFQTFTRGEAGVKMSPGGLGIGLYIARKFIELQGGKIWAESGGKGKGSTFYVELPIK